MVAFIVGYYRLSGGYASLALLANLLMVVGLMSLFEGTLTLPGIAGLVLTVGMAVDANVIIFERIREELRAGRAPRPAIATGFKKATWTILDANITTLITALVLFEYGTGPIKGFAVTLSVGILTSVFAALVITRLAFAVYPGDAPRRAGFDLEEETTVAVRDHQARDSLRLHRQVAHLRGDLHCAGAAGDRWAFRCAGSGWGSTSRAEPRSRSASSSRRRWTREPSARW